MSTLQPCATSSDTQQKSTSFSSDFLAGAWSGFLAKCFTAPMERVKLVLQTQDADPRIRSGEVKRYQGGILKIAKRLYSEHGITTFWRGNFVNVLRYIPQQACNLSFKDAIKRNSFFRDVQNNSGGRVQFCALQLFSAGAGAGMSLTLNYPLDYLRTRLAAKTASSSADAQPSSAAFQIIKQTFQHSGIRGFYAGYTVALCDVVLYRSIQLGCFDIINSSDSGIFGHGLRDYRDNVGITGFLVTFSSALIGTLAAIPFAYPLDSVRRRLMVDSGKPIHMRLYNGRPILCFKLVLREEGISGFYKGVKASVFRSGGSAMVPMLYEKIKAWRGT